MYTVYSGHVNTSMLSVKCTVFMCIFRLLDKCLHAKAHVNQPSVCRDEQAAFVCVVFPGR